MVKQTDIKRWADIRSKGKWSYIINYGVLRFGVSTWVIMMIYFWFFEPIESRLMFTIISLLTFPLAGVVWGRWMWYYLEKLFAKQSDVGKDPN